ncbi:hypothetical protein ABPG74_020730 [Tetrahymena malaccensis]
MTIIQLQRICLEKPSCSRSTLQFQLNFLNTIPALLFFRLKVVRINQKAIKRKDDFSTSLLILSQIKLRACKERKIDSKERKVNKNNKLPQRKNANKERITSQNQNLFKSSLNEKNQKIKCKKIKSAIILCHLVAMNLAFFFFNIIYQQALKIENTSLSLLINIRQVFLPRSTEK